MGSKNSPVASNLRPHATNRFWLLLSLSLTLLVAVIILEVWWLNPWIESLKTENQSSIWTKIFEVVLKILEGISEFTIIALVFGIFFNRIEIQNLIDEAASKFGFLGTVSQMGILGFAADAQEIDHSVELLESERVIICLKGSARFFLLRMQAIVDGLKSGKKIDIIFHSSRKENMLQFMKQIAMYGCDVGLISLFTHEIELSYNYVDFDGGTWIKKYFVDQAAVKFGAPAFYVSKGSLLWERYQDDMRCIDKTPFDQNEGLAN